MKIKILAFTIFVFFILCTLEGFSKVNDNQNIKISNENIIEDKEIRVAIYTDTKDEDYFLLPLKDYNYKVGNINYQFIPTLLTTKNILNGELTIDKYDMLIYSFNQADQYILNTGFSRLPKNKIVVKNINNFIKSGGGYYGSCGGAAIAGGMKNKPKTFLERAMYESSLGISGVIFDYYAAIPIVSEIFGKKGPESVSMGAILLYSGWDEPNPHDLDYSGLCPEVNISKDTAIFDDFIGNTRKIRWIGMEGFEIPENPDREIFALANFPEEEISDNTSTQIHFWAYTGGIKGLIKGLFNKGHIYWCENLGFLMRSFVYSTDFEKTDKIVKTNVSNKMFMSGEIYPNENKARIVRCSGHPELLTWWGGYLEDVEDTNNNNIFDGFYRLREATPFNDTIEDEVSYNYCIIRRIAAWTAKVPDNDLPPVYGPSQVSDIYPYIQTSPFTITGNTKEESYREMFLDLYYRYSFNNNTNWSQWTLYGTDTDGSDGWSWEFNAPNGTGYYQFYSIRRVYYEGSMDIESIPEGPDAISYIN